MLKDTFTNQGPSLENCIHDDLTLSVTSSERNSRLVRRIVLYPIAELEYCRFMFTQQSGNQTISIKKKQQQHKILLVCK